MRCGLAALAGLIALCLLFFGNALAWGTDGASPNRVLSYSVLEDPDGTLTIDEVAGRPFTANGPMLTRGYTPSVHWLKLTTGPASGEPMVLRIRPTYLDRIELYEPDAGAPGGWKRDVTGDRTPFLQRDLASVTLGFAVRPSGPETTYYLRLSTTSTSLLHAELLAPQAAALADLQIYVRHIFILGLLICILLWTATDFAARRDLVVGCFAVNQLFFISYNFLIMGYGALMFPNASPGFVDKLTSGVIIGTSLFSILTNRLLLRQFDLHPLARWMLDALLGITVIALAMLAAGATLRALALNALVVMLIAPLLPVLAFSTRKEAPPGRRTLWIVYSVQAVTLFLTMLPLLGLLPATTWNLDATIIHGLLADLPMFILLALRSRAARRSGIEAQMNLDLTRRQLELQRKQFDMQNRFMAMLTHELRTPLSVIRLAVGAAKVDGEPRRLIESAFGNMAGIIDRCGLADRMDQHRLDVAREPVDIAALLQAAVAASTEPGRVRVHGGALPTMRSDAQLIAVVLHNLIENALKYSPEGSTIDVTTLSALGPGASAGIGLAVENFCGRTGVPDPDQLFEKYYRSPHARTKSGSGLGLYIVHGIADLLGGSVSYGFIEGRARFSLWLPCSA